MLKIQTNAISVFQFYIIDSFYHGDIICINRDIE